MMKEDSDLKIKYQELNLLKTSDMHQLAKIREIGAIIDCIQLSATASKARKESRWGFVHYRMDYTETDDVNWQKHVVLQAGSSFDDIKVSYRPIERSVL